MISGQITDTSFELLSTHDAKTHELDIGQHKLQIVFYGYLVDSDELKQKYNTTIDAMTVLCHFAKKGTKAYEDFEGSYAFAIYDNSQKKLWLVRDKIGTKNIFYCLTSSGIAFASTLRQLFVEHNIQAILDREGLDKMLLLGPARPQTSGIYKGVHSLAAGSFLEFCDKKHKLASYYCLQSTPWTMSVDDTVAYAQKLITNRTQKYLDTDKKLACFLSGGIDSSILSLIALNKLAKGHKLNTVSVDYESSDEDFVANSFQPNSDKEYIAVMKTFLKSTHTSVVLDNTKLYQAIQDAAIFRGLPGMADVDSSLLLLCKEVKKTFDVAVSGECADEIFGGYPWYHDVAMRQHKGFVWSRDLSIRTDVFDIDPSHASKFVDDYYQKDLESVQHLNTDDALDKRIRQLFILHLNWFGACLLERKEMMSGAAGLQVQMPFTDSKIVEFAYNLPWNLKSLNGREKGILRQAFKGLLPDKITSRKKSPYPKSFSPIYYNLTKERVQQILQCSPASVLLNKQNLQKLLTSDPNSTTPWFGQLMRLPQLFGYIIQLDTILREFDTKLV